MEARDAVATYKEIERVRREARQRGRGELRDLWLPFVLYGTLLLATPLVEELVGGAGVGIYWMIAGPSGAAICGWYYHGRELRIGLEQNAAPYVAVAIAIIVGASLLGWIGGEVGTELAWAGPLLVVSAGYVAFSWLDRRIALAVAPIILAGIVVGLWVSGIDPDTAGDISTVAYGGVFIATGLVFRLQGSRQA